MKVMKSFCPDSTFKKSIILSCAGAFNSLICFLNRNEGNFSPISNSQVCILRSGSRGIALMRGSLLALLQHHYSGIGHQHQSFKSNVFASPLQLLYACLCRRNTSPFVWRFCLGGPCLIELCASQCLCAILMSCNVL